MNPAQRTEMKEELTEYREYLEERLNEKSAQIEQVTLQVITTVMSTLDARDAYTQGHSARVAAYSGAIAKKLGLSRDQIQNIRYAALLHDIGKVGIPDAILNKPTAHTPKEQEIIRTHATIGRDILKDIIAIPEAAEVAGSHHEHWDGNGYPNGISGTEIPLAARIVCVADTYDAMTTDRIYRKRLPEVMVKTEIKKQIGHQFDPDIAQALLELLEEGFEPDEMLSGEMTSDAIKRDLFTNAGSLRGASERLLSRILAEDAGRFHMRASLSQILPALKCEELYKGPYISEFLEFMKLYEFVRQYTDRNKQPLTVALITVDTTKDNLVTCIKCAKRAVTSSVRSVDIHTKLSELQYLLLLVDVDASNVDVVTDRIRAHFLDANPSDSEALKIETMPL